LFPKTSPTPQTGKKNCFKKGKKTKEMKKYLLEKIFVRLLTFDDS
jgi:hypothetical protein